MSAKNKYKQLYSTPYDPLTAGSIDGTDIIPHDKAICRALTSKYHNNNSESKQNPCYILFVGRLPLSLSEVQLRKKFSKLGELKSCKIVYDIITGKSKGYGLVEYKKKNNAIDAYHELNGTNFDGKATIVDWKVGDELRGWKPRRVGGGWGGRKESGQLRFGCRDKPWHTPIILPPALNKQEMGPYTNN